MKRLLLLATFAAASLFGQINDPNFPLVTRGASYGPIQLTVSGGGSFTWSVSAGSPPSGVSVSPTGVVSGTVPGTAPLGDYTFTVAADPGGLPPLTRNFTLTVVGQPSLSLFSPGVTLPPATGNVLYNAPLASLFTITGGAPPYAFELVSSLPGLVMNSGGTAIVGVPRLAPTTTSVQVRVRDVNNAVSSAVPISIQVLANTLALPPTISDWTVSRNIGLPIGGSGGSGYYNYSLATGSLPPGMSADLKLGCPGGLDATTLVVGTFNSLWTPMVGGTTGPQFALRSGSSLPPGMSYSPNGHLTGSPTTPGSYSFEVEARDANGFGVYSGACSVAVVNPGATSLANVACPLNFATIDASYRSGFQLRNLPGAPTALNLSGSAPAGISVPVPLGQFTGVLTGSPSISSFTGTFTVGAGTFTSPDCTLTSTSSSTGLTLQQSSLRGVPNTVGTFNFSYRVNDEFGGQATQAYTMIINPAPALSTGSLPAGFVGAAYSSSLISTFRTGGTAPFTYLLSDGTLPPGVNLNASTGALTGTPTTAGTYNFAVRVIDLAAAQATQSYQITINPAGSQLTISAPNTLPVGIVGQPYPATTFSATGGVPPYNFFEFTGFLTATGLTISSSGVLSGTPSTTVNATPTVGVTDSQTTLATRQYPLLVTNFTCPLPFAQLGSSYSGEVSLSPFLATSYAITAGQLPPGFTLGGSTGVVSGVTSSAGNFTFTVQVTDSGGRQVSRSCSIFVDTAFQTTSPRTTARLGVPYRSTVSATKGVSAYAYSIVAGALPQGLTLNPSTGVISGSPAISGSFGYRVRIQDSQGSSVDSDFAMYVIPRTPPPTLRCPLPSGAPGSAYNSGLSLNASGNITYSISSGSLPTGLTLDPQTGRISGASPAIGFFEFNAVATGLSSGPVSAQCEIAIPDSSTPRLDVACPDQEDIVRNEPYASPAIASGGRRPYTFSLADTVLPPGLSLNPQTGLVSGTVTSPTAPPTYSYILRVEDGNGSSAFSSLCTGTIAQAPPITIQTSALPNGTVGVGYSTQILVSGGVPAYQVSAVPVGAFSATATSLGVGAKAVSLLPRESNINPLPPGLQLLVNSNGIFIQGVPTTPGVYPFWLFVSDSAGGFASREYSITIGLADPLRFTTGFLESATVGVNFAQTLRAAGGSPPYTFNVVGGSEAPGVSLNRSGLVQGVPTTAGTFRFTVELRDSAGGTVLNTFALAVFQGNFRLGCPAAQAELGALYNSSANVLGGSQPYAFSITSGQLPNGLVLNSNTGAITGRPTTPGVSIFTFTVSDARQSRTATQCSIGVLGGGLRIITEGPVSVRAGEDYSGTLEAAGGAPPYQWTLLNAAPEAGIIVAANGGFTGRATRRGNFAFAVQVRDTGGATANRTITLAASDSTLQLACPAVSTFTIGVPSNGAFGLTGGVSPYRVSVVQGQVPPGLVLATDGSFTLRATQNGEFSAQIQALDNTNTSVVQTCRFSITGEPLLITTAALPEGTVDTDYSAGLSTSGAVGRVRFGLGSGALPPGLSLDPATGAISGAPDEAGDFTVGVSATDDLRRTAIRSLPLRVTDAARRLRITTESPLSDGFVGRPYAAGFAAAGGKAPYVFTIEGLPAGLSADGAAFGGTPTAAGDVTLNVSVRDANNATAQKAFLLRVKADGLNITTETLPDGVLGQTYGPGVSSEGGRPPLVWSIVSGNIPAGVTFDPATGAFSGNAGSAGPFRVTLEVADASGATARRGYDFEVRPAGINRLSITTESLPAGSAGFPYSAAVGATGGQPPYAWSLNGDLPAGLSFASDGSITGTPTTAGTAQFVVTVTDSLGLRATRQLSLRVALDRVPSLSIEGLPDTANSNQSLPFTLRSASPFGVPVSGRLTLIFTPDSGHGADDPAIRFGNNTRSFEFSLPPNSTTIALPAGASVFTGTLAGTIRIESTLNFGGASVPGPTRTITIARAAPVITAVRLTRSGSSLEVRVEGFTNIRQLTEARLTFTVAGNVDLTTSSQVTVSVAQAIAAWFASSASQIYGGQFGLTLPFNISGDAAAITGVTVVLTNSVGASNSVTAN